MGPVTYGYARASKSDDAARVLDTELRSPGYHGIRADLTFSHVVSVRTLRDSGWQELRGSRLRPGDTLVVVFLEGLSRNFVDGLRIQVGLTEQNVGIVALRGIIDTNNGSGAAKLFRGSMLD